jgi:hypothetical protein
MATEFDDLFSTEEIARSKALNDGLTALNQSEETLDRIVSRYCDLPFHSDTSSSADELVKVFKKSGNQAPARMPAGEDPLSPLYPDDPVAARMDESGALAQKPLNPKPLVSRHFEPVVRMVAELRAHPAIAKFKDRAGVKECWPDIVKAALEYVEHEVGQ